MEGKVVLITGAAVGIGRAVALLMAQKGMKLALMDIDGTKLDSLRAELGEDTEVFTYACDVSDEENLRFGIAEAARKLGTVDILINSAAIWREWNYFTDQNMDTWRRLFDINVTGTAVACQAVLPGMIEKGWGRIITIGSVQEKKPHPDMLVYSASKAAQTNMVESLSLQLAKYGITVNNVAPGVIYTDRNVEALSDEAYAQKVKDSIPVGFYGEPGDCVGMVRLLCSDAGRYITGQSLYVDGGKSVQ